LVIPSIFGAIEEKRRATDHCGTSDLCQYLSLENRVGINHCPTTCETLIGCQGKEFLGVAYINRVSEYCDSVPREISRISLRIKECVITALQLVVG
jgi:hypothetical protein